MKKQEVKGLLEYFPCKAEQPLRGIELWEEESQKD